MYATVLNWVILGLQLLSGLYRCLLWLRLLWLLLQLLLMRVTHHLLYWYMMFLNVVGILYNWNCCLLLLLNKAHILWLLGHLLLMLLLVCIIHTIWGRWSHITTGNVRCCGLSHTRWYLHMYRCDKCLLLLIVLMLCVLLNNHLLLDQNCRLMQNCLGLGGLMLLLLQQILLVVTSSNCMGDQLILILEENIWLHMEAKINAKEELHLKTIHFGNQYSSDLGIVGIVVVSVVKEFRGQKDGCNYNSVDVKLRQNEIILLNESVNVYEGKDKAFC